MGAEITVKVGVRNPLRHATLALGCSTSMKNSTTMLVLLVQARLEISAPVQAPTRPQGLQHDSRHERVGIGGGMGIMLVRVIRIITIRAAVPQVGAGVGHPVRRSTTNTKI